MIKEYNTYPQISVDNFIYKLTKEEFLQNPFLKVLTYEEENIVKAILLYSEIYDRIEINQIEVLTIYQNKHIASYLMDYLIAKAKINKIINITLEVKIDNYKAIKLYQKYNFEKQAVRKKYYDGIDGILMELKMN